MTQFKKGDNVAQILPPPVKGVVGGFNVDQESGALLMLVEWTDAESNVVSRYFKADEIQLAE